MVLNQTIFFYILLAFLVWLIGLTFLVIRMIRHYSRLTKGISKKDLKTLLEKILNQVEVNQTELKTLVDLSQETIKQAGFHIQKIGLVRFNPFSETGGNQSFTLALLDDHNNGLIISSLHSRATTRFYAKKLKKGKVVAGGELSKEEKQALKAAQK